MPIYQIDHETVYDYRLPVLYSNHLAHMLPRAVSRQNWISHSIEVDPDPSKHFRFKTTGLVDVHAEEPPKPGETMPWENVSKLLERPTNDETLDAAMYAYASPFAKFEESVRNYALESFLPNRPIFDAAYELMTRIFTDCKYTPGAWSWTRPTTYSVATNTLYLPGGATLAM